MRLSSWILLIENVGERIKRRRDQEERWIRFTRKGEEEEESQYGKMRIDVPILYARVKEKKKGRDRRLSEDRKQVVGF